MSQMLGLVEGLGKIALRRSGFSMIWETLYHRLLPKRVSDTGKLVFWKTFIGTWQLPPQKQLVMVYWKLLGMYRKFFVLVSFVFLSVTLKMQRSSSRRLCMNFFFSFQNGVLFGRPLNILSFPAENFEVTRKTGIAKSKQNYISCLSFKLWQEKMNVRNRLGQISFLHMCVKKIRSFLM